MAKVSPVSVKYMIYATFESEGPVEKPDVIGAIFGQTEGLLGSDLEMRELQKEGKIGRIEVDLNTIDGKTVGEIKVPSALDKSETTIIAATLETIDKIGPTEAKIIINKIEDVRGSKRDFIIERAKKLLEGLDSSEDRGVMARTLKEESRASRIQEYGDEKLPCGNISGKEIIVVEGRADVVNLLKNRVDNVIGMDGSKLPKAIAELGKEKEITLFVDGDRGGKLIAKNVCDNAKVSYIASAPDGKEVEELTGKEIIQSLRKKVQAQEFLNRNGTSYGNYGGGAGFGGDIKKAMNEKYGDVAGSKKSLLIDNSFDIIRKVSNGEILGALSKSRKDVFAIVIDGSATKQIIESCEQNGVKHLGAKNFSAVETNVNLISL
ncbi:MAG: DNA primase DnaG [Candidatus Pacearchaeota archaeon]|nr:DNA primase DnaG [Candidatus Pacearchaeota archaeon]